MFLRDITIIEEGNSDYTEPKVINFDKVMLMGEQLNTVENYQASDFSRLATNQNPQLLCHLLGLHFLGQEEIEEISMQLKPLPEYLEEECSSQTARTSRSVDEECAGAYQ